MYGATGHPRIVGMEGGKLTDVTALRAPFMCRGQWTRGSRCLIIGQGDDLCSRKAELKLSGRKPRPIYRSRVGPNDGFHRVSDRSRPNMTSCFVFSPERERESRSNALLISGGGEKKKKEKIEGGGADSRDHLASPTRGKRRSRSHRTLSSFSFFALVRTRWRWSKRHKKAKVGKFLSLSLLPFSLFQFAVQFKNKALVLFSSQSLPDSLRDEVGHPPIPAPLCCEFHRCPSIDFDIVRRGDGNRQTAKNNNSRWGGGTSASEWLPLAEICNRKWLSSPASHVKLTTAPPLGPHQVARVKDFWLAPVVLWAVRQRFPKLRYLSSTQILRNKKKLFAVIIYNPAIAE